MRPKSIRSACIFGGGRVLPSCSPDVSTALRGSIPTRALPDFDRSRALFGALTLRVRCNRDQMCQEAALMHDARAYGRFAGMNDLATNSLLLSTGAKRNLSRPIYQQRHQITLNPQKAIPRVMTAYTPSSFASLRQHIRGIPRAY